MIEKLSKCQVLDRPKFENSWWENGQIDEEFLLDVKKTVSWRFRNNRDNQRSAPSPTYQRSRHIGYVCCRKAPGALGIIAICWICRLPFFQVPSGQNPASTPGPLDSGYGWSPGHTAAVGSFFPDQRSDIVAGAIPSDSL